MIAEVLDYLHNYFVKSIESDNFEIEGNLLTPTSAELGQYVKVEGSIFNDGVYKYGVDTFVKDEVFNGKVYLLAIPKELEDLCHEIEVFVEEQDHSTIQSESFGGYSYTKKSGVNGNSYSWIDEFRNRLKRWRKISHE